MTITGRLIIGCTLSMAFCFISPTRASSQTKPVNPPADQDQVLQKLLSEVHELRLAVQRATANSTRFQMLIERLDCSRRASTCLLANSKTFIPRLPT